MNSNIERHYFRNNLFNTIIDKLTEMKVDLNKVSRNDISGVDEFHVRGAKVSKELADSIHLKSSKLLDVGCGLGGPCRMLADEYDCQTTGIDLSEEFINTATKLSKLVGLSHSTKFINGDATKLPLEDSYFDVVWTQHVQMNVNNKLKFYSEIDRVLKEKGTFIYYDIFKKGNEEVSYPMPWANNKEISFLEPPQLMQHTLTSLGYHQIKKTDETQNGIDFFEELLNKIKLNGPPKMGLNLLMGSDTKIKITNLLNGLNEEKIILQSGIFKR